MRVVRAGWFARPGRWSAIVSVCCAAALVAAGCGVSSQDEAQVIDPDEVPFGLLRTPRSPVTTVSSGNASRSVVVYLVAPGSLGAVPREVRSRNAAEGALAALLAGPTTAEAQSGLRSALVPDLDADVSVVDGVAVVRLGPEYLQLSRSEQALGVAQIVYTLTGLPGIGRVRFEAAGERLSVAVRGGEPTSRPIGRDEVLIPPAP